MKLGELQDSKLSKDYQIMLEDKIDELNYFTEVYLSVKRIVDIRRSWNIQRQLCELETGGNIRLEEGRGNEKWYLSCVDLLRSRFHAEEIGGGSVSELNIRKVIRIHNRFLRNKFEESLGPHHRINIPVISYN